MPTCRRYGLKLPFRLDLVESKQLAMKTYATIVEGCGPMKVAARSFVTLHYTCLHYDCPSLPIGRIKTKLNLIIVAEVELTIATLVTNSTYLRARACAASHLW